MRPRPCLEWLKLPTCAQCWDHEDLGGHGRSCSKHKLCLAICRMAAMLGPCMGGFGGQRMWLFIVRLCPLGLLWASAVPFLWLTWSHSLLGSHFGEIVFDKRLNGAKRKLSQEYWRRDLSVDPARPQTCIQMMASLVYYFCWAGLTWGRECQPCWEWEVGGRGSCLP